MGNSQFPAAKSRSSSPAAAGQLKGGGSNTRDENRGIATDSVSSAEQPAVEIKDGSQTQVMKKPQIAAAGQVRDKGRTQEEEERANRNALLLLSVLLVMAMPVVVWRSISQPLLIMWRLSILLCCCSTIWICLLDVSMRLGTVLLVFCLGFALALYTDAALDPKIGVLVAHLTSHFAAGMLGYALAERRERDGTEVSAAAAAAGNPTEEQAKRLLHVQMLGGIYSGLITLGTAACVAWVVCHTDFFPTEYLVMTVFVLLAIVLMFWISFVAIMLLRGELVGETGHVLLVSYFAFIVLLLVWSCATVGDIGAMVTTSLAILGLSGFFGYSLFVYDSFKLRVKLGQLPVKLDKSKEESPPRSLLEKPDEGSKDSPLPSTPSSATASPPPNKRGLPEDSNVKSDKGSPPESMPSSATT